MKVVHLVCTYPPYKGGMGNSVEYLTKSLDHAGCDSTVITPLYEGASDFDKSVIHLEPLFKSGNAASLPQLLFKLKNYDLIHLHYPFYGTHLFVYLACLIWHKPLVLHYHMDTAAPGTKGLIFKANRVFIEPLLLSLSSFIIGSSIDYLENSYIADYVKLHPAKIIGIPFGTRESLLESTQDVQKSKTILFVGALDQAHYFKGLNVLFQAVASLKNNGKLNGWSLEIVGDGELRAGYIETCLELGILESVSFLGKLNDADLKQKYRQAGCLVLPSTTRGEAFGIVLIEAMISGTPVVASNLPGVRSVFTDHLHGLLAEPGDADDLAKALAKMISDESFRTKAGQQSREYALKNYTQSQMADRILAVYKNILRK